MLFKALTVESLFVLIAFRIIQKAFVSFYIVARIGILVQEQIRILFLQLDQFSAKAVMNDQWMLIQKTSGIIKMLKLLECKQVTVAELDGQGNPLFRWLIINDLFDLHQLAIAVYAIIVEDSGFLDTYVFEPVPVDLGVLVLFLELAAGAGCTGFFFA